MRNRVFFPQGALDEWMANDRVEIERDETNHPLMRLTNA